jgi:hypothetical protein
MVKTAGGLLKKGCRIVLVASLVTLLMDLIVRLITW